MRVTYDAPKRAANLEKHGLDFADLDLDFFSGTIVTLARNDRFKALGLFNGRHISVIFKPLGNEAISVISMRYANKKERLE